MISFIKGKINSIEDNSLSVRMGDIAFEVNLPVSKISKILNEGDEVEMYCRMIVRENDISLWGFFDKDSLKMFKELINISGIGPKSAQSLIYELGIEKIIKAVSFEDASSLKVSGVGLKTAQKIILEMKTRISKFKIELSEKESSGPIDNKEIEAKEALIALGYRENDIIAALHKLKLQQTEFKDVQEIIKKVLKFI